MWISVNFDVIKCDLKLRKKVFMSICKIFFVIHEKIVCVYVNCVTEKNYSGFFSLISTFFTFSIQFTTPFPNNYREWIIQSLISHFIELAMNLIKSQGHKIVREEWKKNFFNLILVG
jgi:hypothetical protein